MKIVFVDGYNIINSWPDLREVKDYSLESARKKLTDILQDYSVYKHCKVFLVFDAHMVSKNIGSRETFGNLTVIFTKEGETADSYIEKSTNSIGRKIEVAVVTSDSLEQQVTFQRGATRMSALEFYFEIQEMKKKITMKVEKKYSEKRNLLEDIIENDILEKLEKIRREN